MNKTKGSVKITSLIGLLVLGIAILITDFLYYPLSLPKIITSENSQWIQLSGYLFYTVFITIIVIEIFVIRKTIHCINTKIKRESYPSLSKLKPSSKVSETETISQPDSEIRINNKMHDKQKYREQPSISLWKILFNMLTDRSSSFFFIPISIAYGFFYAIVSSTLIIRFEGGIGHIAGIENYPSIIMMQYGPVGYIPSMSIFLNDNLGILIVPLNLIIIIIISSLVGLNGVSSIYAFKAYISEKKEKRDNGIGSVTARNGTKFLSILSATTSLFAVCPTCASFYLFNILAGSVATTIASITTTYYILFLLFSIPLLIATPIINAYNIKRMIKKSANSCLINKQKK